MRYLLRGGASSWSYSCVTIYAECEYQRRVERAGTELEEGRYQREQGRSPRAFNSTRVSYKVSIHTHPAANPVQLATGLRRGPNDGQEHEHRRTRSTLVPGSDETFRTDALQAMVWTGTGGARIEATISWRITSSAGPPCFSPPFPGVASPYPITPFHQPYLLAPTIVANHPISI